MRAKKRNKQSFAQFFAAAGTTQLRLVTSVALIFAVLVLSSCAGSSENSSGSANPPHADSETSVPSGEMNSGTAGKEDVPSEEAAPGTPPSDASNTETTPTQPVLVADEIAQTVEISVPGNAVPDLRHWSEGAAEPDRLVDKTTTCCNYEVDDHAVIEEYIAMLQSNGFTLVDEYYFSYKDTFMSWGFTCDTAPDAEMIEMQFEGTPCHVSIYSADEGEYRIDISPDLQLCDTGIRRSGAAEQNSIAGPSACAGLLRMPDGSYQTTDGRLSAAVGTAMVIRDGTVYTCDVRHEDDEGDERLWAENYYRNEGFLVETPSNYIMEGDIFQIPDFERERYYTNEKDSLDGFNWHTPLFALAYDGQWKGPQLSGSDFSALTVRVMLYEKGGEAVYYVYARLKSAEPSEVEALCAVDTGIGQMSAFDNAARLSVGDTITINYSGSEAFGSAYHVYEWEITEGAANVSIDSVGSKCTVTALQKGVASVTVTYEYTVEEPDVLTGYIRDEGKSKRETYNIIIE